VNNDIAPGATERLIYNYSILRQYNSVTRGERVNIGVYVKDKNTGRCMSKIREDLDCIKGIVSDATDEYCEALKMFFPTGIREWQEEPDQDFKYHVKEGGMGRAMACNQLEKAGFGLGHTQRGCENPKDLRTLEACLDDLFERFCTPYKLSKDK
jgi:hypothetical protein